MMHPETHAVKASDERPARRDGACFYCRAPLGGVHWAGCVIRSRTVVCEFRVTLVRGVPEDWDERMVEFHMNDSSWCMNNLVREMDEVAVEDHCLCGQVEGKFLREATQEDEEQFGVTRGKDEPKASEETFTTYGSAGGVTVDLARFLQTPEGRAQLEALTSPSVPRQLDTVAGIGRFPMLRDGLLDTAPDLLLRCPFCSHEAAFKEGPRHTGDAGYNLAVHCSNGACGVRTPEHYRDRARAAEAWNRRTKEWLE
jgi:hypothetical protein